jgi:hypothetical protein
MSLKSYLIVFTIYAILLVMWVSGYIPDFIMDDPNLMIITFVFMNVGVIWGFRHFRQNA